LSSSRPRPKLWSHAHTAAAIHAAVKAAETIVFIIVGVAAAIGTAGDQKAGE
jgi:hypothetical protein